MLAYIGDGIYVDAFRVVSVHPTRNGHTVVKLDDGSTLCPSLRAEQVVKFVNLARQQDSIPTKGEGTC